MHAVFVARVAFVHTQGDQVDNLETSEGGVGLPQIDVEDEDSCVGVADSHLERLGAVVLPLPFLRDVGKVVVAPLGNEEETDHVFALLLLLLLGILMKKQEEKEVQMQRK